MEDPMTINTLNHPIADADQSFVNIAAFIGETVEEKLLLLHLLDTARQTAPQFADAFAAFLLANQPEILLTEEEYDQLRQNAASWFIHLFGETTVVPGRSLRNLRGSEHIHLQIPTRYLLASMAFILGWGERVTAHSPQPHQAMTAFWKSLSLDIASHQVYEDLHLSYLNELVYEDERL
jgi:hypothetical protein